MRDCISRQAVIDLMMQKWGENFSGDDAMQESIDAIREMPSVTPQEPCDKCEVGNPCLYCKHKFEPTTKNDLGVDAVSRQAVLNTLDNMDSALNEDRTVETYKELLKECYKVLPSVTPQEPRWIPVSEKLPNDRDWYLGIFKEPDTGWINPLPFICDYVGSETKATTKEYWILRGLTDRGERIDYYFNLECVAWMPLPTPYEPQESENT